MLCALVFGGIAAAISETQPKGEYGSINGIPISRQDFEACGGKIPEGCPGGLNELVLKPHSRGH